MKHFIRRCRLTWNIMPRWAKLADLGIVIALAAAGYALGCR